MNTTKRMMVIFFAVCLASPTVAMAGKGYMGGSGTVVVAEEPVADTSTDDTNEGDTGGTPDTVEGPLNDKMSDAGKLYGDLYVILRQQGGVDDIKLVPAVNVDGTPVMRSVPVAWDDETGTVVLSELQLLVEVKNSVTPDAIVGGEPVLTVTDPGNQRVKILDEYGNTITTVYNRSDYGWYAADTNGDGIGDIAAQSPYPAQCVQPVASYERWGDISSKTGLTKNRLPMTITYDTTWNRSECEVGKLVEPVTVVTSEDSSLPIGTLVIDVDPWFIEPCDKYENGDPIPATKCQWTDPNNGLATYPDGVLWTALIGEVHFGRLNLGRSPDAVLQAAYDEAINTINSPDTIAIEIDAAGRLLLTKNVYDELLVYTEEMLEADTTLDKSLLGQPVLLGIVKKAIDSPLENVALYAKLMKDGHLVTPGDERMPIDRSTNGGIPLWKMLELTDGPGAKALRPTIDIAKMRAWGLGSLVDVKEFDYVTYYQDTNDTRTLVTQRVDDCADYKDVDCKTGITTYDGGTADADDFNFAASFISAAADKTGHMTVDMIVYLNSILGINQVLGYSAYDDDGNPAEGAIDYEKNPVYFNFKAIAGYNRTGAFGFGVRGNVSATGGGVEQAGASSYDGNVTVLLGGTPSWKETDVPILSRLLPWDYVVWKSDGTNVINEMGVDNIFGFTQQADDNLSVIRFIHTYQIPGLR